MAAPTTTSFTFSADSRARNAGDSDNCYSIALHRPVENVQSIQLANFQVDDMRPVFEDDPQCVGAGRDVMGVSEPLKIPAGTYLRVTESDRGGVTAGRRTVCVALPPTMNRIESIHNGMITCEHPTGLFTATHLYPTHLRTTPSTTTVDLRPRVVGCHFPHDLPTFPTTTMFPDDVQHAGAAGPVLSDATIQDDGDTHLNNNVFSYVEGYLNFLSGGVGDADKRHVGLTPNDYTSYVHCPPPTLLELCDILNECVHHMRTRSDISGTVVDATTTAPVGITTTQPHHLATGDTVTVTGVGGNTAANTTTTVTATSSTTFTLDGTDGTGHPAYVPASGTWTSPQRLFARLTFQLDARMNTVVVVLHNGDATTTTKVVLEGGPGTVVGVLGGPLATSLAPNVLTPLGMRVDPNNVQLPPGVRSQWGGSSSGDNGSNYRVHPVRTVRLPPNPFSDIPVLGTRVASRLNSGTFHTTNTGFRTVHYTTAVGQALTAQLPYGRMSGHQIAGYLTAVMSPTPGHVHVTYEKDQASFTFRHAHGLPWTLDFTKAAAATGGETTDDEVSSGLPAFLHERLGFDRMAYTGSPVYTSVRPAMYGDELGYTGRNSFRAVDAAHKAGVNIAPLPCNEYHVTADANNPSKVMVQALPPVQLVCSAGTTDLGSPATWTPIQALVPDNSSSSSSSSSSSANQLVPYAHRFSEGDVLFAHRPVLSSTQDGAKRIVDVSAPTTTWSGGTATTIITVTTASAHGMVPTDMVCIATVQGIASVNGTWPVVDVPSVTTFTVDTTGSTTSTVDPLSLTPSYVTGTGVWWSSRAASVFTVVVASAWDPATGTSGTVPALYLQPTASLHCTEDDNTNGADHRLPLGAPATTDGVILLQSAHRNVFMVHNPNLEGTPASLGFPRGAWPPSSSVPPRPVATAYTAPHAVTLRPPDYILMVLKARGEADTHVHTSPGMVSAAPIFAKLMMNDASSFTTINEQIMFTRVEGNPVFHSVNIEFRNPDGSFVDFCGRPHNFTLVFVCASHPHAHPPPHLTCM